MTIIRSKNQPVFIDRDAIEDERLWHIDLGIYAYICSKPPLTNFTMEEIEHRFPPCGQIDQMAGALNRLKEFGYISIIPDENLRG